MFTRSSISWSVNQIVRMMEGKGKSRMRFDDALQRDTVWRLDQKQLFIDSILRDYPIPALYAERYTEGEDENTGKRVYSILDGKQRCTAMKQFLNGEYKLSDVADPVEYIPYETETEDEAETDEEVTETEPEMVDVSGMYFDDLPQELQDTIKERTLTVYYLDNMSEDEKSEMFYRLNNGVALTAIEKSRVRAVSREKITKLATTNPLFTGNFSEKQIKHYATEDIVFKSWIMLHIDRDKINLDNKYVRPLMETTELSDADMAELDNIFSYINDAAEFLRNDLCKKTAKKLATRTNLITVVPIVKEAMETEVSADSFAGWFETFFPEVETQRVTKTGKTTKTYVVVCKSSKYDKASKSGANHHEQVITRLTEMENSWNAYKVQELAG